MTGEQADILLQFICAICIAIPIGIGLDLGLFLIGMLTFGLMLFQG